MNIAYKHLDAKLRIAELSIGQWITIAAGAATAITWGLYLSPLGPTLTLVSAIYLGMLPTGAALLSNVTSVSPSTIVRSAFGWHRRDGRFMPGPGEDVQGYVVVEPQAGARDRHAAGDADLTSLWETAR